MLIEFTGLATSIAFWSRWLNKMVKWPFKDSGTVLCSWTTARFFRMLYMFFIRTHYTVLFLWEPGFIGLGIRGEWHSLLLPSSDPPITFLLPTTITLCSAGLRSKRRNASTRRHNSDTIQLKVKTASRPFSVPHASEPISNEGNYYAHWVNWFLIVKGRLDYFSTTKIRIVFEI